MSDSSLLESASSQPAEAAATRSALPVARVLHVINGDDYSGAERVQDLFGLRLPEFGYEVAFACLKPGRFAEARASQQAPLFDVPMHFKADPSPVWSLARLIRRERFDLVHTHSVRTALVGRPAAALARVPMVHHMHCQTATEARRVWLSQINAVVERVSLSRVAAVIAASETLGRYLRRQRFPEHLVTVVPNGVAGTQRLADRKPPTRKWTIGAVAMFRPRKGTEVLLEAISLLKREGLAVRFRAVGCFQTAEYEREVKELAQRLGLVDACDWVGFTRDVPAELQRMDLFVLPSVVAEGLPMSVLEAMAAGVPVVATRVDGVTDAVRDRVDGLLADPASPEDLASKLASIIRGEVDWNQLRATAHARQLECFSDTSMARAVAQVYQRVLDERKTRCSTL